MYKEILSLELAEKDPIVEEYRNIFLKTEEELTIKDLRFLTRQSLLTELTFPKMIEALKKDLLCREYYDGEGLHSLSVFKEWTPERKEEARKILSILEKEVESFFGKQISRSMKMTYIDSRKF